jgi:hypothetical protein
MVFAGAVALIALVLMVRLGSSRREEAHSEIREPESESRNGQRLLTSATTGVAIVLTLWLAAKSPSAIALVLLGTTAALTTSLMLARRTVSENLWDHTMLHSVEPRRWYARLWFWWAVLATILVGIYVKFW